MPCFTFTPNIGLFTRLFGIRNVFGKEPGTLRFVYEGERVNPQDTPAGRGMEDGDVVDAHLEQVRIHHCIIPLMLTGASGDDYSWEDPLRAYHTRIHEPSVNPPPLASDMFIQFTCCSFLLRPYFCRRTVIILTFAGFAHIWPPLYLLYTLLLPAELTHDCDEWERSQVDPEREDNVGGHLRGSVGQIQGEEDWVLEKGAGRRCGTCPQLTAPSRGMVETGSSAYHWLKFTYHGTSVRGGEDETPDSLGMEESDQIDAHVEQRPKPSLCGQPNPQGSYSLQSYLLTKKGNAHIQRGVDQSPSDGAKGQDSVPIDVRYQDVDVIANDREPLELASALGLQEFGENRDGRF
ncbi:hypothetical protein EW146_g6032 [Bondarzewia mesenterica]|uniref:Ubiquitin-like domain-containing protein n=1 Tax=Bondarzewia mesenterica TaxID=1095465 RepID=A0A4S4LRU1_9AGAM|nr:hypothetical protein EW146_g6032 [Bondarzewia mesenterica]